MKYYRVWMKIFTKTMERKLLLEIDVVISLFIEVDFMYQNLNSYYVDEVYFQYEIKHRSTINQNLNDRSY